MPLEPTIRKKKMTRILHKRQNSSLKRLKNTRQDKKQRKELVFSNDCTIFSSRLNDFSIPLKNLPRKEGKSITKEWFYSQTSFDSPFIVDKMNGLGMKLPPSTFTLEDFEKSIGSTCHVQIIEVETQTQYLTWTLRKWMKYFQHPESRQKILNVISLEFSHTKLVQYVQAPQIVRDIGWVEQYWPHDLPPPKTQLYCLMSVGGSWTDFHIDFGGSSVWYHIFQGSKIFYFIPPTIENLRAYSQWSRTGQMEFLPNLCTNSFKVQFMEGQTAFIPTGWIHAVYTPMDSIAFGGNFLHSLFPKLQFQCEDIEKKTGIIDRFRFPHYRCVIWYVAKHYYKKLVQRNKKMPLNTQEKTNLSKTQELNPVEMKSIEILCQKMMKLNEEFENFNRPLTSVEQFSKATAYSIAQNFDFLYPKQWIASFYQLIPSMGFKIRILKSNITYPSNEKELVFCICGATEDDGTPMIACDECDTWLHMACNGFRLKDQMAKRKFVCQICKNLSPSNKSFFFNCLNCQLKAWNYSDGWKIYECMDCHERRHVSCKQDRIQYETDLGSITSSDSHTMEILQFSRCKRCNFKKRDRELYKTEFENEHSMKNQLKKENFQPNTLSFDQILKSE